MTELITAAVNLAKRGLPVFPAWSVRPLGSRLICSCPKAENCTSPGKHPMVPRGVLEATTDAERVSYWWRSRPDANIGLATGSVVDVIDIDPRHGGDRALIELESKHYKLPPTWHVATGGGGQHIYFAAPPRRAPIKNSVGHLGPGIDVRGLGGYVIAPPSAHISGRRYQWDCGPHQTFLCMLPPWLAALLDQPSKAKPATEWRTLVQDDITEGRRNDTAARLAGHLLRRYVDPHVVLELLLAWNATRCRPPLDRADVVRTVDSIAGKELRRRSA